MTTQPTQYKVGDEVILVRRMHRNAQRIPTTVTKVGRKYFWVKDGYHYQKFHLHNGSEVSQYGAPDYVTTPEIDAENQRRTELIAELRECGCRLDSAYRMSSQSLTRILAVVVEEVAGSGGTGGNQ